MIGFPPRPSQWNLSSLLAEFPWKSARHGIALRRPPVPAQREAREPPRLLLHTIATNERPSGPRDTRPQSGPPWSTAKANPPYRAIRSGHLCKLDFPGPLPKNASGFQRLGTVPELRCCARLSCDQTCGNASGRGGTVRARYDSPPPLSKRSPRASVGGNRFVPSPQRRFAGLFSVEGSDRQYVATISSRRGNA